MAEAIMILPKQNPVGERVAGSQMLPLIRAMETLCRQHYAADIAGEKTAAMRATLAAYNDEISAITERASYLPARSAAGAAFKIALATIDAELLEEEIADSL